MSIRLRDTGEVIHIRWIPKYTLLERLGHWVHASTYIPLAITGCLLFVPGVRGLTQGQIGEALRVVHRVLAVIFMVLPVLYLLFQPRRLFMNLREVFQFSGLDIAWLKAALPYYLFGRHEGMPPQPRFNTGERLNAAIIIVGTVFVRDHRPGHVVRHRVWCPPGSSRQRSSCTISRWSPRCACSFSISILQ